MAGKGYLWCLFLKMGQRHLPDYKLVCSQCTSLEHTLREGMLTGMEVNSK